MTHGAEIIAALSFGVLAAVAAIPLPRVKPPEIVEQAEKADARKSAETPETPIPVPNPTASDVLPPQVVMQQQHIDRLEQRVEHIDLQVQRIEQKLEVLDARSGDRTNK